MRSLRYLGLSLLITMAAVAAASAQNVTVSGAVVGNGSYPTVGAAFTAINGGAQPSAVISVSIVGDTSEAATATLNAGTWTSLTISPGGGAARTVSGTVAGNALITLDGADNVTIDGLNTGGNSLTISNLSTSSTAGTSTIKLLDDATSNLITNCSILGSATISVPATDGGNVWIAGGAVTTGNDNNIISNNNIGPAGSNLPSRLVWGSGTTTTTPLNNSGVQISGNNLFDFFNATLASRAVDIIGGNTDWTVSNNKIYQTATRTWTTGAEMRGISISNTTSGNNFQVTGNTIGFASAAGTGTFTITGGANLFKGIHLIVASTTASNIQNNTIANINQTTTSSGTTTSSPCLYIYPQTGLITTTGNTIGSPTGTGSLSYSSNSTSAGDVIGIFNFSSQNSLVNNNNIGSITATNTSTGSINIFGIRTDLISTVTATVTGNTIGGSTTGSINNTAPATSSRVVGIFHVTGISVITGNTIRNSTMAAANASTGASASVVGISQTATAAGQNISQNTIFNLSNTNITASVNVVGISQSGATTGATNIFSRNLIHSLSTPSTNTAAQVIGIGVTGGVSTFQNNMIALGNGLFDGIVYAGVSETGGTDNFYHNSVYISGSTVLGTANTFAFSSTVITNVRNLRDNIFFNARSNGAGTGTHYAIQVGGTAANPAGLTSNNNILFANGTGGAVGRFNSLTQATLANWQTATGQDANSISANPQYNDPNNATPDLHLHPTNPTPAETSGGLVASVTDDFDGQTRSGLTPVDIGADAGNFVFLDVSAPIISYTPLGNTSLFTNRTLSVTISDASGVATGGNAPRIYFNKNAGTYFSTACTLASGTVNNGSWNCVIDNSLIGGVVLTDVIRYFVVAQDTTGNLASNPAPGFTGSNVNTVTTPPTTPNQYTIVSAIGGSVNVGVGQTYTSLTNAGGVFQAINSSDVTSNITINITSDLSPTSGTMVGESGTVALNQFAAPFTVTIQSSGGSRTIEGAAATGLIRLDGADSVGLICNSQLLFRNQSSAPAILFTNDATNNSVSFCAIESANTSTTSGTVMFGTSTGSLGNSNNVLGGNQIRERTDVPTVPANGVYSAGSAGAPNSGNFVSNGNVFNFTNIGVLVSATGAGNGWTVNSNSIYQGSARTTATEGIAILGGSGHAVNGNFIGGSTIFAVGSPYATSQAFRGIDLAVGTVSPTIVYDNVIKNIRSTLAGSFTASYGIFVQAGRVDIGNPVNTSNGNSIGSSDPIERIEISGDSYAIRAVSTSTVNIRNNTINNFTTAPGVPTGEFYFGISTEGTGGVHSIVNNSVMNVTNGSTPDASFNTQTIGIVTTATGIQTIRGNTVSGIGNTSTAAVTTLNNRVWGMVVSATAAGTVVERNNINNIYGSSPTTGARADVITAMQVQGTNTNATLTNNFISTDGGTAGSSDRPIFGIIELASGGTTSYLFNSVNVYGTSTGANFTYAFNRNSLQTVSLRNNIFSNRRAVSTGENVAMANTNASATGWSAAASNNNLLFNATAAHITQWLGGAAANNRTLATFQTDSGGDAATTAGDPLFVSNTDLHIVGPFSPAMSTAVAFGGVTTDFDSDPRPGISAPDRGADEIVQADGGTIPAGTFYNAQISNGDTVAGNFDVTNVLYIVGGGNSNVGANTVGLGCNATVVPTIPSVNYIVGNVRRDFCSTGTFTFPVGTTPNGSAIAGGGEEPTNITPEGFLGEYSPMTATINAGTVFPSSLTVNVVDDWLPQLGHTSSTSRYWNVTETGTVNADMLFQYLNEDVYGNEPLYNVFKWDGTFTTQQPGSVNAGANQFTATGVTNFSGWAAGVINVVATNASVSGRVTTAGGNGIRNATVVLTGNSLPEPLVVQTGSFGIYSFDNLRVGETYVLQVGAKRFRFANPTRVITLEDSVGDLDFVANPQD